MIARLVWAACLASLATAFLRPSARVGRCPGALHVATQAFTSGRNLELASDEGQSIVFDAFFGGRNPSILYLPCLNKAKNSAKASNLESWCRRAGHTFLCADYLGVSRSKGDFLDGTVGRWTDDTIRLIEAVSPSKKVVLVGAGVGGWIMLLVAKKRPDLVAGLVGLAADPDFTEVLLWQQLPEDVKEKIMADGVHEISWGQSKYPISRSLIMDGRDNLVLTGDKIQLDCPVRLVHGLADTEVPIETVYDIADLVTSDDVSITLVKDGTHFLDSEGDFARMRIAVQEVIESYYEVDLSSPGSG